MRYHGSRGGIPSALVAALAIAIAGAVDSERCVPAEEVREIILDPSSSGERDDRRTNRTIVNIRLPGTASTKLMDDVRSILATERYLPHVTGEDGCDALCFDGLLDGDGVGAGASGGGGDDPFVRLTGRLVGVHAPFDHVMRYRDDDAYVITTIREPFQYARKFFVLRGAWDDGGAFPDDVAFREWIERAPWRTNQVTRMLGREVSDRRRGVLAPGDSLIGSPGDREDAYMLEQNELGERSEILARAWERLQDRMVWFGIFHRLRESYELLAFALCSDGVVKNMDVREDKRYRATGAAVLEMMLERGSIAADEDMNELAREIARRNRLDSILMERAEALFDERLTEMQDAKARGVICRFMNTVEVTCANGSRAEAEF